MLALKSAWQYFRELRFMDLQDRAELQQWCRTNRGCLYAGFVAVLAVSLFMTRNPLAQACSMILIVIASLLLMFA